MNREILFRGKVKLPDNYRGYDLSYRNGDWIFGLMNSNESIRGIFVDTNTIGQYTGLTDKNGTKIFEGDIVKYEWGFLSNGSYHHYEDFIVEFKDSAYYLVPIKKHENIWTVYLNPESEYEVVGNIYDTNI